MPTVDSSVADQVRQWLKAQRDELINMSRRNRLLYFKHSASASLEIVSPGAAEVLDKLARSTSSYWNFNYPPEDDQSPRPPKDTELVIADKTAKQIDNALRQLERKSNQDFVDKGLWVLYLGLGMLNWTEAPNYDETAAAPLVLVPVTIARDSLREPFRLRRTDDDPVINPALTVKLEADFDLRLPNLDVFETGGFKTVLDEVAELTKNRKGWSVNERVVLGTFTFQKEAMYRDLLDNEGGIAEHPMVQLLAAGQKAPSAGSFDFEPVADETLDSRVPPEDLVSVRDANATQRACVIAARDGRSFVMDGPPGTGKSQTITNIIAELLHVGKTVLFVSEKAAALDVVYDRLRESKLEDFVLRLHSHNATRKAVASELGRALTTRPQASSAFTDARRTELVKRRQALSNYAQAMNEVRQPLGRSLHDVLGEIARLHRVPQAPIPDGFGRQLSQPRLTQLLDAAAELGRAWGPVLRGERFLWRDLRDTSMSASRQSELERMLNNTRSALRELHERTEAIDGELGVGWYESPEDASKLLDLVTLLDDRPTIPVTWLTQADMSAINQRCSELSEASRVFHEETRALIQLVGGNHEILQAGFAATIKSAQDQLKASVFRWQPNPNVDHRTLHRQAEFLRHSADALAVIADDSRRISDAFRLSPETLTVARAAELADLAALVNTATRPESAWFNPAVQAALTDAVRILGELVQDFRQRRDRIRDTFTDGVLELDLTSLHARFATVHRGFGKLKRAYRKDKQTLAACTVAGKVTKAILSRLEEALAWKDAAARLSVAEKRHADVLGKNYYHDVDTDFARVEKAVETARKALQLAGAGQANGSLAEQLALGCSPNPALPSIAERLRRNVDRWREVAREIMPDIASRLVTNPIDVVSAWTTNVATAVSVLVQATRHVSDVAGRPMTLTDADQALTRAAHREGVRIAVNDRISEDAQLLGARYAGVDTDWKYFSRAAHWASAVRAKLGGPVHREVARALLDTRYTSTDLRDAHNGWQKARDHVLEQFDAKYAQTIAIHLTENFDEADLLLHELAETVSDITEWSAYVSAKRRLEEQGLEPVIRFCVEQQVPTDQVKDIVKRALLEAWADDASQSDKPRIGAERALDRDAIVDEFQVLDKLQVEHAAARVINACTKRRPHTTVGEAGIIQRQGTLQRKHMPIRTLLSKAGGVAQRLKPCFMMSPLSVSQYLPPTVRFDAVIFDEASQVRPADAINCIYRGDQLIVAGDEKQLPPTSFFSNIGGADDDFYEEDQIDEFESVLELCKGSGGLRSLPLLWHYRSRHESLITFSNYRIYEGSLFTFPGAKAEGEDVGLELFKVDGTYRRGGPRDNPVEAARVIDRVLHHRRHHPHLTLGVVTFSTAQQHAIEAELERRAGMHPELEGLIGDDRLHGFFVKSIENVQGDERDLIIFSIGYGPDEHGKFTLNFGPLNKRSGHRRLNVAITRAKQRVEVVTSVLADSFPSEIPSTGVRLLKRYLDFAARGMPALALDLEESLGDTDSPFEEEVMRVITSWGYDAVPQVGVAGYRIDIGVRDPARPGSFALGVECDGAMYHSSKAARDRDRLRQEVLEGLGWRIHRIWSTAWYRDRNGQEARLHEAIEAALRGEPVQRSAEPIVLNENQQVTVEDHTVNLEEEPSWTEPYRVAEIEPVYTPHEMHVPQARPKLRRLIEQIVRQEGPVHEDRVLQTVRQGWGVRRAGSRIREAFDMAVLELLRQGLERDDDGFLDTKFSQLRTVRVPTEEPDTQREAKHVPQSEIQLAITSIVREANTVTHDEVSRHVAALFGWRRRGPDVRAKLEEAIAALARNGTLMDDGEHLRLSIKNESG
jgi:very-short-patch-repair endonuclease